MGLASKYPIVTGCLLIPVVIVTGLVLLLTPVAYQNYRGVCRAEGRVLTDDELIRRVVASINSKPTVIVRLSDVNYQKFPYVPYASVDDFLKENPQCCNVSPINIPIPLDWRFRGMAYKSVDVTQYLARYVQENGYITSAVIKSIESGDGAYLVENCGTILGE